MIDSGCRLGIGDGCGFNFATLDPEIAKKFKISGNLLPTSGQGPNLIHTPSNRIFDVFYTWDPQGSPVQKFTGTNTLTYTRMYDTFGDGYYSDTNSDSYNSVGGQWGYWTDSGTGLCQLGHRFYDPSTGRFVTRDPSGYEGGINVYAYVWNNPASWVDINGDTGFRLPENCERQRCASLFRSPVQLTTLCHLMTSVKPRAAEQLAETIRIIMVPTLTIQRIAHRQKMATIPRLSRPTPSAVVEIRSSMVQEAVEHSVEILTR